jgi:hypothetical protein
VKLVAGRDETWWGEAPERLPVTIRGTSGYIEAVDGQKTCQAVEYGRVTARRVYRPNTLAQFVCFDLPWSNVQSFGSLAPPNLGRSQLFALIRSLRASFKDGNWN